MTSQMAIIARTRILLRNHAKSISTFPLLSQKPELADPPIATSLPPNPASGSPFYQENWRSPVPNASSFNQTLAPQDLVGQVSRPHVHYLSETSDPAALMNEFANLLTQKSWNDIKQMYEIWIQSLDKYGKPNIPNVDLFNHYLRANLMLGGTVENLLDLVARLEEYGILPNTASYNLVLKAMFRDQETVAARRLLERMLGTGEESLPDDESYDLIIGMLFSNREIDAALNYTDLALKSNCILSSIVFSECVKSCLANNRLDHLVSIFDKCKTSQNKFLCPTWNLSNAVAEEAIKADNNKLAFYALEFMARLIARGEATRPEILYSVDEGLIISALSAAGRTHCDNLLTASWAILLRSLRQKRAPRPESYLGKINALASLGNLPKAFTTLFELESAYGSSVKEDIFSPFTSLYPLVVACSKKGYETLDLVYFQLEQLSRADPPRKSVSALNCIILGSANIWDLDRAYQTFEAISSSFGLTPDIHSYNCLMYAFGKLKKTLEASRVFEHLASMDVKPNAMTYSLLVDAHLINRDPKAAISAIDNMKKAGFQPTKDTLKKVRRRSIREEDYDSNNKVQALAAEFKIRMGTEVRRDMLFNLDYSTQYA